MADFDSEADVQDEDEELGEESRGYQERSVSNRDRRGTAEDGESINDEQDEATIDLREADLAKFVNEHVFKSGNIHEENEILLRKIRKRIDNVGLELPTVEIRYRDLTAEAEVYVGSRALPTLYNTILDFIDLTLSSLRIISSGKTKITILESISGILKPGRMTLLLGPPSSGKTTLLQALAAQSDSSLKVSGEITYNGYKLSEFQPKKTSIYVSQDNVHIPEFTVRETMEYSTIFQGSETQYDFISQVLDKEKELGIQPEPDVDLFMKASVSSGISHKVITEYYMKMLGLDVCSDTIVGDHMRKGLSGGQVKRLTTGEMLVGSSTVLLMDNISTGLDSSTTFHVVKCMGQFASILGKTVLISLLQPAPETFRIFDDIMILASSQIVYHGPRENVEDFFESQGFKRPPRKDIADYLQELVSLRDQKQYWADKNRQYKYVPAKQFAAAFKSYTAGQQVSQELEIPFQKSEFHKNALSFDYFSLPTWELFKVTFRKELLYYKKTIFLEAFMVVQMTFTATVVGALFFRTERNEDSLTGAQEYAGALFLIYLIITLLGFGELTLFTNRFPTLTKFRAYQFYPSWAWCLSTFLLRIPSGTLEASVCVGIVYYIVGFAPSASRFFKLLLMMATMTQMSAALFRMVAGLLRVPVLSSSIGGFALVVLILLGGFIMPRYDIRGWWIWGYWALPLSYGQNAIIVNEFLDNRWNKPIPGDSHTLGHRFILSLGLYDRGYWYWLSWAVEVGFTIIYNILLLVFITTLRPPSKSQNVIPWTVLEEREKIRTGATKNGTLGRSTAGSERFHSLLKSGSGVNSSRSGDSEAQHSSSDYDEPTRTAGQPFSSSLEREDNTSSLSPDMARERRGMVLPFQPYTMTFKNVNYSVDMPKGYKERGATGDKLQLLHEITGAFRPGVLTALVGVTGAGKSTLMDVLSGRKTRGYIEGDIRINGYPKRHETFTRIAGYCEQFDVHSSQITVQESVTFSAFLRLQPDIDADMKKDFVEEVIDLVELDSIRDALVGIPGQSGLSIEQRKRLTIAVELVANPSIIFMDEPTSGLDARAAATVMRAVRNTVDTGRTVVCTIHQPSIDIFESFDELLLLKTGGYVIYAGPLGTKSQHLVDYFVRHANVPPIQDEENPAAWMLNVTHPGMEQKLDLDFAEIFKQSSTYKDVENLVDTLSTPPENVQDIEFSTEYALSLWDQFKMCLWKQYWTYWRSPGYNLMRIFLALATALLQGSLYWGYGRKLDTERTIYSFLGTIFISIGLYGVLTCNAVQPLAHSERTVFYRERGARMYSELPYALAQFAIEIPYVLVATSIYQLVIYSMLRFHWDAGVFFWQFYFTFMSQVTHVYLGFITVSLTPNPELASIIVLFFITTWFLTSGYALPLPSMPPWTKWLYWINPQAYFTYGSVVATLGKIDDVFFTTRENKYLSVKDFLRKNYGFRYGHLKLVGPLTALFPILFALGYVVCIKKLNFQSR